MNFALITTLVLALAAINTRSEGRNMHAHIRGRDLVEQEKFDGLPSLFLSLPMPMSMSMSTDDELVGTTEPPVEICPIHSDLASPSIDSSVTTKTYIVTFADDDTTPLAIRCADLAKLIGGTVTFLYTPVLKGCALTAPVSPQEDVALQQAQEVFMTLSNSPVVRTVKEDHIFHLDPIVPANNLEVQWDVNTELLGVQSCKSSKAPSWGLDRINQCKLPCNDKTTKQDAKGVMVFIVDSGIRGDHVEFKGQVNSKDKCHFSAAKVPALTDNIGHGTFVAGTACGVNYGVASNCRLCSVSIVDRNGDIFPTAVLAGLKHIADTCRNVLCVANMSIGLEEYSEEVNEAVANVVKMGVVVVVAAGNDKKKAGTDACLYSPGSEPSAITVGSIDEFDKISNQLTDEQDPWASLVGPCIDVYAPGSHINSAYHESSTALAIGGGTSAAAPHVTGIAAAIRSANKKWNPTQVRNAIVHSAVLLTPSNIFLAIVDGISCPAKDCERGKYAVEIRIFTDEYPNEIAWTVKNSKGITIRSRSSPYHEHPLAWSWDTMCLPSGRYLFTITDTYGDGICCDYGHGEYTIRVRGRPVFSGGEFTVVDKIPFIVSEVSQAM
ncbi:hypothetical protein ACHAWU_008741 [Discostella pseudostelligera]|uniref:subtilisin n=1 Tax=Discostella pseudostelligera TaxID=259834 RepID=A0ABD3N0B2_9STRA